MKGLIVMIALALVAGIFLKDKLSGVDIDPDLPPVEELEALAEEMNKGLPKTVGDAEWYDTEARDGIIVKHYELMDTAPSDVREEIDFKEHLHQEVVEEHCIDNPAIGRLLLNGVVVRVTYSDVNGNHWEDFGVTIQDCMAARAAL